MKKFIALALLVIPIWQVYQNALNERIAVYNKLGDTKAMMNDLAVTAPHIDWLKEHDGWTGSGGGWSPALNESQEESVVEVPPASNPNGGGKESADYGGR